VFSARGKLEHIDDEATTDPSTLLKAVEKRLLSRRIRREQPERALELWHALISGRWSIIDHVDTDGKRFIVARRNDVSLEHPTALQRNERLVVLYAAWGHSNKLIAYELGLAPSTISVLLRTALRKLRLRTRADLLRLFSGAGAP
jgi:DNA-binding CsgD family transcriptional regulator